MKNPKKLFDKKMVCPNCHSTFDTKKPILSRLKVIDFETDGHKIYKDSSPLWYELNVCPICGFVFDERLNNTLYTEDIEKLLPYFSTVKDFKYSVYFIMKEIFKMSKKIINFILYYK